MCLAGHPLITALLVQSLAPPLLQSVPGHITEPQIAPGVLLRITNGCQTTTVNVIVIL